MDTSQLRKRCRSRRCSIPRSCVPAIGSAFVKLDPRILMKNPVMFVPGGGHRAHDGHLVRDLVTGAGNVGFEFQIVLWLWFTVLFANFAEAVARGPRQGAGGVVAGGRAPRPRPSF